LLLVTHFIHEFVNVPIFSFSSDGNALIVKDRDTSFKKTILMKN